MSQELSQPHSAIAILGSASDVGKSLVAAALCRMITDAGFDTVPFKAQNMANQAGVSAEGLEMPRAQILQALACRKRPSVDMGPVLMKPVSPTGAQIVVLGKVTGYKEARDYFADTSRLAKIAEAALDRLMAAHRVVIIEGAGSPVEINLWPRDFTNLRPARRASASIVLVVDIDRGGSFAQAKGTLDLMPERDRQRVIGIVVNRFRGDRTLFDDGIGILEEICRVPVLAVIPHFDHGLDEEDRPLRLGINEAPQPGKLHVGAVLYPRVSNTEDLSPLLVEPDLQVTWITDPRLIERQDLIVLPGTKATLGDLTHITATGIAEAVMNVVAKGAWVLGICGGYQMLGWHLTDAVGSEGGPEQWPGLRLLPFCTEFGPEKILGERSLMSAWPKGNLPISGYEIHQGRSKPVETLGEPLALTFGVELGWRCERAVGGYLHGLLASDAWRSAFLNQVRAARGLPEQSIQTASDIDFRISRWAAHVKENLRPGAWERILGAVRAPFEWSADASPIRNSLTSKEAAK
jgi:adenosylcobyric acid synthase